MKLGINGPKLDSGCLIGSGKAIYRHLFASAANAQCAIVGVEGDFVIVERPSFIEIEPPRVSRRVSAIISYEATAPLITSQEQISLHVPTESS
jgi:hypothetical protein